MAVTPNYSWPVPVNTDYVKDGADAIKNLGDAIDATVFGLPAPASGLTLVKSQTIGTAVTSVTVTDAFSATYDNYKIFVTGGVANAGANLTLKLGASATGYYMGRVNYSYAAGSINGNGSSNQAQFDYAGAGTATNLSMNCDLYEPNKAVPTRIFSQTMEANTGGAGSNASGWHNVATAYTDFTLSLFTGGSISLTGGTIRVYGYQN